MSNFPRVALLCSLFACATAVAQADSVGTCLVPGQWSTPSSAELPVIAASDVLSQAHDAQFVLLGEAHDNADDHLWQLQTLAMLLGARDQLVIGMEMFPRRVQPALDRWIAAELTESELLQQTEWASVWRFDADLYLPILRFARLNRIHIVALNVERSLVSEIGARGLQAVPPERREGVSDPAPASPDYRNALRSSFHQHANADDAKFGNFVDAQLFWDRAFAQALAGAASANPAALIVGIIGSGHLRFGHGVPYQLKAMGYHDSKIWLPLNASASCAGLSGIADSIFAVGNNPTDPPPRLGVYLGDDGGAAGVRDVAQGSVAEGAGIMSGDRILFAAGVNIRGSDDLVAIVRRQSPGTWLPITVERNGQQIELVAKFPAADARSRATDMQRGSNPDADNDN